MSKEVVKKKPRKNNPYGANQYRVDPRQALYLELYLNPDSETFGNSLQSALKAGFAQEYSESLTSLMPTWLSEKLGELDMLAKAERNLNRVLEMKTKGGLDIDGEQYEDPQLLKIQVDVSKFVAERLNRKKYAPNQPPTNTFNTLIINDEQAKLIARRHIEASDSPGT